MTFPHHLDPPGLWDACADAAVLVAQRILAPDDVVASLHDAAVCGGYAGDIRGLRTRILWAVRDGAEAWGFRRDRAEWDIRRGLGPLLEARAPAAVILAEAERINAAAGHPLLRPEVAEVVKEAMRAKLRRAAGARRRRHA